MADEQMVEVRFSEVHWYQVKVPKAELDEMTAGQDCRIMSGPTDGWLNQEAATAVGELLTAAAIDQSGALKEVDGQEISWVRLVS